jgi:hypothetical protein
MAGHVDETVRLDSTDVRTTQWYSEAMYIKNVSLQIPLACLHGGWAVRKNKIRWLKY